jgi:transcriptional regulator GlxA family with amidase domain
MAKISFIVSSGCSFSGIAGLIDSFGIANLWHADREGAAGKPLFETEILSLDGKPVQVAGGYQVTPDGCFTDREKTDVTVVPSFLPNVDLVPENATDMLGWVRSQYRRGSAVAALCTGAFVLAETGLLDHRQATTNWLYARKFRRRYPRVHLKPDQILTSDAGLICSGTSTAFYSLGLHLIEIFGSADLSALCSKSLLIDTSRTSQASYTVFNAYKNHGDLDIRKAQDAMESRFAETISMEQLARQVGISPRHFIRRFRKATGETPLNYLQQIRIETAKTLLETGNATVDEITQSIGYENSGTFRKLFKTHTGLSPREYRDKFTRRKQG